MSESSSGLRSSNDQLEILLFSLGSSEVFGINVFKIREVTDIMELTKTPGRRPEVKGMISLRGSVLPVVDLAMAANMTSQESNFKKLIIAEFASRSVAFSVADVDKIVRVNWDEVKPPQITETDQASISGIILLESGKLVSLLDVESICQRIIPMADLQETIQPSLSLQNIAGSVFFVDDSKVARKQITNVVEKMGLRHASAISGDDAQSKLMGMASNVKTAEQLKEKIALIMVDEEMPGMDGCMLTKMLRADERFKQVPIIMYSSLTCAENERRGLEAGVDLYVQKFDATKLADAIKQQIEPEVETI